MNAPRLPEPFAHYVLIDKNVSAYFSCPASEIHNHLKAKFPGVNLSNPKIIDLYSGQQVTSILEQNCCGQDNEGEKQPPAPAYGVIDPDYARIYTKARCIAWSYGYSLVIHGSFTRDLDLIAVPWTANACSIEPGHLMRRIADVCELRPLNQKADIKEHGRRAWTLALPGFGEPRWVDFSVLPASGNKG